MSRDGILQGNGPNRLSSGSSSSTGTLNPVFMLYTNDILLMKVDFHLRKIPLDTTPCTLENCRRLATYTRDVGSSQLCRRERFHSAPHVFIPSKAPNSTDCWSMDLADESPSHNQGVKPTLLPNPVVEIHQNKKKQPRTEQRPSCHFHALNQGICST